MELFFYYPNSPFFWVRAGTLYSPCHGAPSVSARVLFESISLEPKSALVFNRFNQSRFFSSSFEKAKALKIPTIFDVDDLYWDLPSFSTDPASKSSHAIQYADSLAAGADVVTTTNSYLAEKLSSRFKGKRVEVIGNAVPTKKITGGFLIANTDSFKFSSESISWFSEIISDLIAQGWGVQFIGKNSSLLKLLPRFSFGVQGELGYSEYLDSLSQYQFGLVPVESGDYSDCKSEIKLLEFLQAGLKVIASDIRPYRELDAKELPLQIVPNTKQAWSKAISKLIETASPDPAALYGREQRERQYSRWEEIALSLEKFAPSPEAYLTLTNHMRNFYRAKRLLDSRPGRLIRKVVRF